MQKYWLLPGMNQLAVCVLMLLRNHWNLSFTRFSKLKYNVTTPWSLEPSFSSPSFHTHTHMHAWMRVGSESRAWESNNDSGCSLTHGDVGELFPEEYGRPLAAPFIPLPHNSSSSSSLPGYRRPCRPMRDKKGLLLLSARMGDGRLCFSPPASISWRPQTKGKRDNKNRGRKESKKCLVFWGLLLLFFSVDREKRKGKAWAMW